MFLAWTFDLTSEGIRRTVVTSRRGTASIAASLVLLVAGTAGLFLLINPSLQERQNESTPASVPIQPNSLAILPFVSAGENAEDEYMIEGLSDALRDQLSQVSGLRIAARSSSMAAVERGLDALAMSSRLGVASLVEGTVRRERNLLRVTVQLIDGRSGLADWSQTFERGPREFLAVQEDIAKAIVGKLLPGLDPPAMQPATRDPTANELMVLARHYEQQVRGRHEVDVETLLESIRLYREATEADPDSALAHSRLAGSLMYLGDLEAAEASINRALSIDPGLSEVQNTLGEFRWAQGLIQESRIAWQRAVELNPNNPDALQNYARARWWSSSEEGAEELYRRAVALDALNLERHASLGAYLALENQVDEAREVAATIEQIFDDVPSFTALATLFDYIGDVDRSIAWTIRARDVEPDNPAHVHKLAEFHADIEDFGTALQLDPNGLGILFKMRRFEAVIE
ncbi:MAG: tetratricopeptide repeat protein, partial [Xanthomonadales bacterium]|nr:tetratricopeptide repeat protein [Xanthomonadales bacterium]